MEVLYPVAEHFRKSLVLYLLITGPTVSGESSAERLRESVSYKSFVIVTVVLL